MDLQILISKKGTQVVTATNLHRALRLPAHKYNGHVDKWLSDVYAFRDDIRQPSEMQDYARRNFQFSKQKDFYLSIEMARLITLSSESEVKQQCARYLMQIERKESTNDSFNKDQIIAVLELTKVMGLISCQQSVEQFHQKKFRNNKGKAQQWWQYRADMLGYSVEELKNKMMQIGKQYKGKNLLQMLMYVDKYEIIRMAVIDLLISLGKSRTYASSLGDLAKIFAKEMNVRIWDDRDSAIDFDQSKINPKLADQVKNLTPTGMLGVL